MADRILILDEIATNRMLLKAPLAAAGYDVLQAADPAAALALLDGPRPPRAVLLSDRIVERVGMQTAGGDGGDGTVPAPGAMAGDGTTGALLRAMRRQAGAVAPVLVVLAAATAPPEARLRLLGAGADEVLLRPLDPATLLARIRGLLRRRRVAAALAADGLLPDGDPLAAVEREDRDPPQLAVVAPRAAAALSWAQRLGPQLGGAARPIAAPALHEAMGHGPPPDLVLLVVEGTRLADLRQIAELRARPDTENAALVVLGDRPVADEPDWAIMALDLGAVDVVGSDAGVEELVLRLRLRLRQKRAADRHRASLAEGLRLARTDPLTGLLNRRATLAGLAEIASGRGARRSGWAVTAPGGCAGPGGFGEAPARRGGGTPRGVEAGSYALMILDIDRFKAVNDGLGHCAGDAVLAEIAARLSGALAPGDLLGRIGGEEFLIALPATGLAAARRVAERLRGAVAARPVRLGDGRHVRVTVSIGLCLGGDAPVETVRAEADRALYAAKAAGRDRVGVAGPVRRGAA